MLETAIIELTNEIRKLREVLEQSGSAGNLPLPAPILLRAPEVAKLLGISRARAYSMIADGTIPSIRLGRSVRVPRNALSRAMEKELES
jgi:excisionase family DNA binding protein